MCAIKGSYPKVGFGQILKPYLEYFSSYVHTLFKTETETQNLNMGVNDSVN